MVNKAVSHYRITGKPRDLISDGQGQMGFNSGAAHRFKRPGMLGGGSRAYSRIAITAVQLLVFLMQSKPGISAPLTFEARRSMWWTSASSGNERFWGNITFDKSKISLRGTSDKISLNFDVGWDQIDRLRVRYGSSAEKLHLTVHLKPVSYRIDYVDIYASPRDTWNLIGALMSGNPKHK